MRRQTGPQEGTGFRMLRAQFWTLAQSKCISKGVQKWTLLGSKVVPPGGSVFGPFILSDVVKLCRLPCAQNFKLEATLRQTASAAGILNCSRPLVATSRLLCHMWRWCMQLDSSNTIQERFEWGVKQAPRKAPDSECWGPSFGPLRKANVFQKGSKNGPS